MECFSEGVKQEEVEELLDQRKGEIKEELKDEIGAGDTRIDASLGMFSLTIDSDEDLETTVAAFSEVWTDRIQELEESRADTVKEKLDDSGGGGIFIG